MYQKYIKRLLDIIISLILIVITFPITIIVAISLLINLGWTIYNQKRLRERKNKKTYLMYKLRTRKMNTYDKPYRQRYTKFSYFIDRTHLNELPALFNVLKGDMSIVGPRPFIPNDDLPSIPIPKERYLVKPGLTSLAQIKGGATITHNQKLKYDVIYYQNLSFLQDLKIVFLTPWSVIKYR